MKGIIPVVVALVFTAVGYGNETFCSNFGSPRGSNDWIVGTTGAVTQSAQFTLKNETASEITVTFEANMTMEKRELPLGDCKCIGKNNERLLAWGQQRRRP